MTTVNFRASSRAIKLIVASFVTLTISTALAGDLNSPIERANAVRQIQGRLLGYTKLPTDALTTAMLGAIAADPSDGGLVAAARLATNDKDFSSRVLRDYFAVMQNLSGSARAVPFNSAIALAVKSAAVDKDIRRIFTANEACQLRDAANALVATTAFDLPANENLDLRTALVCTTAQSAINPGAGNTRTPLPANEVMGMFTAEGVGSFAENAYTAGTNLRVPQMWMKSTFGRTPSHLNYDDPLFLSARGFELADLRSSSYSDQYVGPFLTRNPSNLGITEFQNNCVSCHGLHHSMVPCRNWDYTNGSLSYNTNPNDANPNTANTKCVGSDPANTRAIYPNGFIRRDNCWNLTFTAAAAADLGFTGVRTGCGLNELGTEWSKIDRVYVHFVERILTGNNGVCPGITIPKADLDARVADLKATGDIVEQFARLAAHRVCLGI